MGFLSLSLYNLFPSMHIKYLLIQCFLVFCNFANKFMSYYFINNSFGGWS